MNSGWPDTIAYYIALMTVIGFPAMLSMWFVIHPFARFWRKAGAVWTYLSVFPVVFAIGTLMFLIRKDVLSVHYGVRLPLVLLGVPFVAAGFYIGLIRLWDFSLSATIGMPELAKSRAPARLVTTGIYALIRHPRYVEIGLVLAGIALMVNYLAVYITLLLYVPVIYLIVVLEERELRERFGAEYEDYCRRVPRFWPKKMLDAYHAKTSRSGTTMVFIFIDYSDEYYRDRERPNRTHGKFVLIRKGNDEYFIISPKGLTPYHAYIVEKFCREQGIAGAFDEKHERFDIRDTAWAILGGGKYEWDESQRTLHLHDDSMAYGKFPPEGLRDRLLRVERLSSHEIRID